MEVRHRVSGEVRGSLAGLLTDFPLDKGRIGAIIGFRQDGQLQEIAFAHLDRCQPRRALAGSESLAAAVGDVTGHGQRGRLGDDIANHSVDLFLFLLVLANLGIELLDHSSRFGGRNERHEVARRAILLAAGEGKSSAIEDTVKGVIILAGDGVVFVIVAARAANGQAEDALAEDIDGVFERQEVVGDRVEAEAPGDGEIAGGGDLVGVLLARQTRGPASDDVAGELLAQEAVIGKVLVERADDLIAIAPGVGHGEVGRLAGGVGIAHQVEPVPTPFLAVVGRGQQPVHQALESIGVVISDEVPHLFGRGRQADEVEHVTRRIRVRLSACAVGADRDARAAWPREIGRWQTTNACADRPVARPPSGVGRTSVSSSGSRQGRSSAKSR